MFKNKKMENKEMIHSHFTHLHLTETPSVFKRKKKQKEHLE